MCGTGATIALTVVAMTSTALITIMPPLFARYASGTADPRVLTITLIVALACAVTVGVLPAWRASRVDVLSVLQSASASRQRSRLRGGRSLIVVETALAVPAGADSNYRAMVLRMEEGVAPSRALLQQRLEPIVGGATVNVTAASTGLEPALRDPQVSLRPFCRSLDCGTSPRRHRTLRHRQLRRCTTPLRHGSPPVDRRPRP